MKYLLLIFFSLSLYAQESCYTVQIISVYKSDMSLNDLSKQEYDSSCKVMEIGKNVAVRCGCFERYIDAKKTLPKFKAKYKNAYIMSTYKSRFAVPKPLPSPTPTPSVPLVKPTISTLAPIPPLQSAPSLPKLPDKMPKATPAEVEQKSVIVTPARESDKSEALVVKAPVIEKKKPEKIEKVKKNKKSKKKKKVKKKKYVKKREAHYKYERYLDKLESKKGIGPYDYRYKFGAQLSYDFGYVNEADEDYFKSDWRRIRVYHKGSFFDEKLFYELEYSFTGANKYKDNFIGYEDKIPYVDTKYRIKAGNIKIPFSLERYTSSKNNTFMERALNDAFAESRKLGVELLLSQKIENNHLNIFASLFSNSLDQRENGELNQPGYSLRATYAYKFRKEHLFSLGGAYWSQAMQGEKVKFSQGAESEFLNEKYVSVSVKKVDTLVKQNIELLYVYDKYSLQGEYTLASLNAINKSDIGEYTHYSFPAYYLQGSYFIIGKGVNYSFGTSTLGKVKPKREGAVEIALRYSHIDLNDKDEDNNGAQTDYNFGLNWYFNRELKFMLNYIVAQPKETKLYDGRLNVLEGRVLFAF